jgi:predicted Ser/Thr protein kinase
MNESDANPNMENKCPQCGAPLPSGVLAGLCPACLFKQGAAADTAVPPESAAFQPPSVEEIARLFPNLEIIAFIGKGGMGAVYKARQPGLDRIVALKIIPPQTAAGPGFIERFNREARALAKLSHPNIVAVHEFGQVNGLPYFIMEFVDGLNLRELERAGKLSAREALQIVPQICEALQFAHDEGIVHRDIKPENILLDKKGRVKIADFGIAKILHGGPDAAITETGGAIGTPHYMAPEQMEKPTSVDHRADIFSLGVVFYEMLTGELPLGKFAPPSSRKVEVDVRLDEVVLRALEKDPELRYQHASQVKTAVDTIAGSAAPPPASDAQAIADDILARDYTLDIGSCIRRGWKLLRANFWPFVGITALLMALIAFASSANSAHGPARTSSAEIMSGLALLLWGPLFGGFYLYLLKKIRGEKATVETVFSGFSHRFLHLFLGGFASGLLTWLGFVCFVIPGIYLLIAWMFTLPLIADKQLDFWSAMELSRKVVTKHWFKFFFFGIFSLLYFFLGALAFGVGIFVTIPLVLASMMYAYEDVFGAATQSAAVPPVMGPFGTATMPSEPPKTPPATGTMWTRPAKIGLAGVALVILVFLAIVLSQNAEQHRRIVYRDRWFPSTPTIPASPNPFQPVEASENLPRRNLPHYVFGPVIERELAARSIGTNQFLDLDTEQLLTPPEDISSLASDILHRNDEDRFWETLDIPQDSRRFKYPKWLQESGADLMYAGDGKIVGFDGVFPVAHGNSSTNWDDWDGMTPESVRNAVEVVEWPRRVREAQLHGRPTPPAPSLGGNFSSAFQLTSQQGGGPLVNLLTRDQSVTWFFKTREGRMGVMQLVSFTNDPPAAQIRYKLLEKTNDNGEGITTPIEADQPAEDNLGDRYQACLMMTDFNAKNKALSILATNAASAGNAKVTGDSLRQINDFTLKSQTGLDAVRLLAKRGLRKDALAITRQIEDFTIRDQALSELAQ